MRGLFKLVRSFERRQDGQGAITALKDRCDKRDRKNISFWRMTLNVTIESLFFFDFFENGF